MCTKFVVTVSVSQPEVQLCSMNKHFLLDFDINDVICLQRFGILIYQTRIDSAN